MHGENNNDKFLTEFGLLTWGLGPVAKFGGWRDWARPGLARRFETTRRRRIADV